MKKTIIIFITLICSTGLYVNGQEKSREQQMAEIRSMKIAFMTEFMKLTPDESEKFWPIYNQYWSERGKVAHRKRRLYDEIENSTATENHIKELVKLESDEAALIEKYADIIAKALSIDKAAKTFVAEEMFKGRLLRRTQGFGMGTGRGK